MKKILLLLLLITVFSCADSEREPECYEIYEIIRYDSECDGWGSFKLYAPYGIFSDNPPERSDIFICLSKEFKAIDFRVGQEICNYWDYERQ